MGLISKVVKIKAYGPSISYYKNLGYDVSHGKEIEVSVHDLMQGSNVMVECECDYCGTSLFRTYREYNKEMNGIVHKIACSNCRGLKTKESNLITYGVENISELDEIKTKKEITFIEHYGVSNYLYTQEYKDTIRQNNIEKYGVEHHWASKEIIEKRRKNNLVKYGVENVSQLESIKQKKRESSQLRYGTDSPLQVKEIIEARQATCLQKYGVKSPLQNPDVLERLRETNRKKRGVDYPTQSKEVMSKIIATNLSKYGQPIITKVPEIKKKISITLNNNQTVATSIPQKYIHNLYGGELNGVVSYYNCDIVFRDEKLICEADLGGHDLCVKLGTMTEEEFKRKEIIRNNYIKKEGFRIIRIISRKDYLPSDTILLQMLQYARDFFAQNPERSWISFDIDSSRVYNAYHKESEGGIPYDFGSLRKIKKSDLRTNSTDTTTTPSSTLSSPTLSLNSITA